MSSEKLNSAIAAIKSGDKVTGSRLLNELLKDEPSNETAWIWLATTLDDVEKKKFCLKKALSINPNNQVVNKALERLEQPPQPALEEIIPNQAVEIPPSSAKTFPDEMFQSSKGKSPTTPTKNVNINNQGKIKKKIGSAHYFIIISLAAVGLCLFLVGFFIIRQIILTTIDQTGIFASNQQIEPPSPTQTIIPTKKPSVSNCREAAVSYVGKIAPYLQGITEAFSNFDVYNTPPTKIKIVDIKEKIAFISTDECVAPARDMILGGLEHTIKGLELTNELKSYEEVKREVEISAEMIEVGLAQLTALAEGSLTPTPPSFLITQNEPVPSDNTQICFPPTIPGISFAKVKTYLANFGITCNPMIKDALGYSGNCEGVSIDGKANINVEIYSGKLPDDIYLILSSVAQLSENPSDETSANILGIIAKIPYTNSNPEQAQLWVENNISSYTPDSLVQDQPIEYYGGVRYHMSCASKSLRCLAIGQGSGSGWDYNCNVSSLSNTPTPATILIPATSTPIPEPIIKTGSGNSIVSIEKWDGPALIHIKGSGNADMFFHVTNDDGLFYASGFEKYDGVKTLDFFPDHTTKSFEIKAGGEWTIEIYPLANDFIEKRVFNAPGKYQGNNDDVLFIEEGKYRIIIDGNSV